MANETAAGADLKLTAREFQQIGDLAYERFGLDLKKGKEALVASRLGKNLRKLGFRTFADYHQHVLADSTGEALVELIDALTTNHTSFLRERAHFEFLARAANEEFRGVEKLRVWSAACSSGEEPYSIAMCLAEALARSPGRQFSIRATDISTRVLDTARRGVYPAAGFGDVPEPWRRAHLLRGKGQSDGFYKVKPELSKRVEFDRFNLIEPFAGRELFHVIFCRNVMMYFDRATQQDIVQRLSVRLERGGYLFVGHSESLTGIEHGLHYVRPATYRNQKPEGGSKLWR
ncbi:MAG TPA: protein-glutamate O-methyltransferase CheR [Bryobacteraceae bacterium]|jgi:chemotaxis protein methyltransferase CheR|nr:protein-glutamate O-methyltransferase CheR [Bryobacteraceae bacterium]